MKKIASIELVKIVRKLHEKIQEEIFLSEVAEEHDCYNDGYEDALGKLKDMIEIDFEEFIKF
jgi:hypothetical protein